MNIFSSISLNIFLSAQKKSLTEMVLLNTQKICFGWEIWKVISNEAPVKLTSFCMYGCIFVNIVGIALKNAQT